MEVGAIQVAVNPAGTADELAGLLRQVSPALVVSDGELMAGAGTDALNASAGAGTALPGGWR